MRGHVGVDRCVDDDTDAETPFVYPAMPAIEVNLNRPDPWVRAVFSGLGVIGLASVLGGPVVGVVLALVAGGVVALTRTYHRPWGDGTSRGSLRPWPHVATLPVPLAGTELLDVQGRGQERCGVVWHRPTGLMSATALLAPCPTAMREPAVAEAYAACWWGLLEAACARPEIRAAALTVEVLPGGEQHPLRLTLTVDPGAVRTDINSVADAAALTVRALAGVDVEATGLVGLRPADPADLARITRAGFEPRCGWSAPQAEPVAWGELTPDTEADLPRVYRHERYGSLTWALHVPPRRHPRAEAIPALLQPGRHPRRVTLIEHQDPHETIRSVYVTSSVSDPSELDLARSEVEALVRTVQPRLQICRDRQAQAFAVGLPVGWFPPHPVESRYEAFR